MLVVVAIGAGVVVPGRTWARVLTLTDEVLEGGSMTGRSAIWKAGFEVFPNRPLLGAGFGAYGAAVEPVLNKRAGAHNMPLGVLVEQGIVGFCIYAALLAACGVAILRMPPPERKLWGAVMLSWLVGVMSLNWEYRKVTWLLFGLVAAQSASDTFRRRALSSLETVIPESFSRRPIRIVDSPSFDRRAVH